MTAGAHAAMFSRFDLDELRALTIAHFGRRAVLAVNHDQAHFDDVGNEYPDRLEVVFAGELPADVELAAWRAAVLAHQPSGAPKPTSPGAVLEALAGDDLSDPARLRSAVQALVAQYAGTTPSTSTTTEGVAT